MQVRDVMTRSPACCTPDTGLNEVARLMLNCDCGEIPVVETLESRRPVGVVTDRDIVCRVVATNRNPAELRAGDVMTREVETIGEESDLQQCLDRMESEQIRRIPVLDSNGSVCGIVAQADIAREADPEEAAEVLRDVSQPSA